VVRTGRRGCVALAAALWLLAACADHDAIPDAPGPFDRGLFPWSLTPKGDGTPLTAQPGGTWAFDFDLEVDLRQHVPEMGRFRRILLAVYGELRHDARGDYRSSSSDLVLSTRFTTSGVPIAASNMWPSLRLVHGRNGSPFEGLASFELPADGDIAAVHELAGRLEVAVPADIPHGWWHPRAVLLVEVEGVALPVYLAMFYLERQAPPPRGFPLVEIGAPAPPRLPFLAFQDPRLWGRAGTLPRELAGKVGVIAHATFPTELVLPPGRYPVGPTLPTLSPINAVPEIYATEISLPSVMDPEQIARIEVTSCGATGPDGPVECLRGPQFRPDDSAESAFWEGEAYGLDMAQTGTYDVALEGVVTDRFGRRFTGGGTYRVHSALPLTFSTSCKPGTSFLVGGSYSAKVNVNPPVRAAVEVVVWYWPQSDPARKREWRARGDCNRLGHFVPDQPPLVFDEPGEYRSEVRATFRDPMGRLWMGIQGSAGVVAPEEPDIRLRPAGADPARGERLHAGRSVLVLNRVPVKGGRLPEPPLDPSDTLFVNVQPDAITLENRFSVDVRDPQLARRLREASAVRSAVLPRSYQHPDRPWTYLQDVLLSVTATTPRSGLTWQPADPARLTDVPIGPAARGPLDPLSFPGDEAIEAWVTFGSVRPGLSALVGVAQRAAWGSGWQLSPNAFGFQVNAGRNGDRAGDIYRIQAGVVIKDHERSVNHYDLYAASVVIQDGSLAASAVLPPGARPLTSAGGVDQYVFLAADGFGFLEQGEHLDFGGMVFPNVRADVTWSVTPPSGERRVASGRADRRGIVVGRPSLPVDELGLWRVQAQVRHGDLVGGIPGSPDGFYWACVIPRDGRERLHTGLPPVSRIRPWETARVPLTWDEGLRDVTIHFATVTPGLVIEHGSVQPAGPAWTYSFTPLEAVIRAPNFDFRQFANGELALADLAVMMFCLEARDGDRRVADAASVILRGDALLDPRVLETAPVRPPSAPGPPASAVAPR